ncbi:hypothetical protein L3Y34_000043 [Caenorhabditis briggsae]|uniref:C2H2-type domain-containing protein n=1 Tax=Caenorhabditis briggsae TaxID=6238 RepID=A0AAE9D889_CAEBR|nr:hypothetical protein L3Y34_000043 [Caenorhabditis briggsae]
MKRPQNPTVIKEEINYDSEISNGCSTPKKSIKLEEHLKCELCSTVCSSISQLQSHTLSEHVPDRKPSENSAPPPAQRVACQQCEETFESFANFAVHMKSHIGSSSSQIFFCPICPMGASFRDKKAQLEHLTTNHLQIQVNQIVCTECGSMFATPQALSIHFVDAHKKIVCTTCDFVAENDKVFKEHSKVHSRQVTMYGCALCATSHTSQQSLITHVQLTHDQDTFFAPSLTMPPAAPPTPTPTKPILRYRPLQCSVCDEQVVGEDGLDEHRLRKHCKVRYADKCADCQELLLNEANFVEHCLRHAKDHAHHCPVCRQSLRSDAQIQTHCAYHMTPIVTTSEESTSPVEPSSPNGIASFSFVCPICGEKLEDGFALLEHTKQHL